MAELGRAALVVTLGLCMYATIAGAYAASRRRRRLAQSARNALIAAFGLLMLELSAYFALVQIWSAISAAAILGVVNFVIAAVLFVVAGRPPAGRELELATEIHGSAVEALQSEARALQTQFAGMLYHPLNSVLPSVLVPLIMIIVKSLKKSKAAPAAAEPS